MCVYCVPCCHVSVSLVPGERRRVCVCVCVCLSGPYTHSHRPHAHILLPQYIHVACRITHQLPSRFTQTSALASCILWRKSYRIPYSRVYTARARGVCALVCVHRALADHYHNISAMGARARVLKPCNIQKHTRTQFCARARTRSCMLCVLSTRRRRAYDSMLRARDARV